MAEAKIGIQIGADVSNAVTNLKKFDTAVASTSKNLSKIQQGTKVSTQAINSLNPATKSAGQSLQNFNRIVSDAPFGLIGIANNIEPALESFSRLKLETGSTGGALKALGASLLGPQGIIFGISVATSLLIAFGDKLFDSGKKAEDAKDKIKSIADIQAEVSSKIGEERARVETLIAVLENQTTSRKRQKAAIDELNKIAPEYFGNLKTEDGLVVGLTTSYEKYNNAVLSRVRTQVLTEQLVELEKQIVKLEDGSKTAKTFAKAFEDAAKNVKTGNAALDIEEAARKRNEATKFKAIETDKQLNKLLLDRTLLLDRIRLNADSVDLDINAPNGGKVKPPKEKITIPVFAQIRGIDRIETGFFSDLFKSVRAESNKFLPFSEGVLSQIDAVTKAQERIQSITDTVLFLGQGLNTVFENIANGGNAIQSLGNFITQLIKKLVIAAAQAAILAAIITAATGGTAGAASFGATFKTLLSSFSGLPKFAEGGVVNKATFGIFGEAGPEAVIPLNQLGRIAQQITGGSQTGGLVASGVLRGTDILLSVTRQQRQNGINY